MFKRKDNAIVPPRNQDRNPPKMPGNPLTPRMAEPPKPPPGAGAVSKRSCCCNCKCDDRRP